MLFRSGPGVFVSNSGAGNRPMPDTGRCLPRYGKSFREAGRDVG